MGRRRSRGFTLIEIGTAMAILGALVVIGFAVLSGLRRTASYSTAVSELVVSLRKVRAEAFGSGNPTLFVVDTVGRRWWGIEDVGGDFSLDTFAPATPAPAPDRVIAQGTLPANVTFGPADGFKNPLPAPFSPLPTTELAGANYAYCSFCRKMGTNVGFGAVQFQPGGVARFDAGPAAPGQVFTLASTGATPATITAVAVVGRTGVTYTFEVMR